MSNQELKKEYPLSWTKRFINTYNTTRRFGKKNILSSIFIAFRMANETSALADRVNR